MAKYYVLVEGIDDEESIKQLFRAKGFEFDASFEFTGKENLGKPGILRSLGTRLKSVRPEDYFAVVLDADDNSQGTWESVRVRLLEAGFSSAPSRLPREGLTLRRSPGLPQLGVWLMPDNETTGMLEDFIKALVPEGDVLLPMAHQVVDSVVAADRRFPPSRTAKAVIHSWLAWQEQPGTRMGSAISRQYLDPTRPEAEHFVTWLKSTFEL